MKNYDRVFNFLIEAPISYDDETERLAASGETTNGSKWVNTPPSNATVEELVAWVEDMNSKGVLGEILGSGATRECRFNDGKTVFKFNYDKDPLVGNQIRNEIIVYNKYKDKYADLLPTIYKHGLNWMVVQKLQKLKDNAFFDYVGLGNILNDREYNSMTTNPDFWRVVHRIHHKYGMDVITALHKCKTYMEASVVYDDKCNASIDEFRFKPLYFKILQNDFVYRVIEFCDETGVVISDMASQNTGYDGEKVKILDFGYRRKKK